MWTKFVVVFCVVALAAAIAGSIPAKGPVYHITLTDPSAVNGVALKAGEYRVTVNAGKATFVLGKESHEVAVKVEESTKKFSDNSIQFDRKGDQNMIKIICVGGTKTKLLFN
jgi:hypothetical protein